MKQILLIPILIVTMQSAFCQNEWIHLTTKQSLKGNSSQIKYYKTDKQPGSIIFIEPEQRINSPVGIQYKRKKWRLFRIDRMPLEENLTFRIIMYPEKNKYVWIHTTDTTNTIDFCTVLNYPSLNGNSDAKIDLTFNHNPNGKKGNSIEVYYELEYNTLFDKWVICYPEDKVFPMGASFNIRILESQ